MSDAARDEGGCLCGAVRYSLDRDTVATANHCHCRDCQRSTGGGFVTFVALPESGFELASGDLGAYTVTGDSGGTVTRSFCRACGSALYSQVSVMPGFYFVKAGSLDDASWVKPASSYWVSTAQPWAPAAEGLQGHARNPG